jgi:hypothetical protein
MKKIIAVLAALLVTMILASATQAQISPVKLRVHKLGKKDVKTNYQSTDGWYRDQSINESVYYEIEVAHASTKTVNGIKVNWAIVVQPPYGASQKVIEGSRTTDSLSLGQKFTFETDTVDFSKYAYTSPSGRYESGRNAGIVGYAVEVLIDNKVVASDYQPMDIKRKIEGIKAPKQQPGQPGKPDPNAPKKHTF